MRRRLCGVRQRRVAQFTHVEVRTLCTISCVIIAWTACDCRRESSNDLLSNVNDTVFDPALKSTHRPFSYNKSTHTKLIVQHFLDSNGNKNVFHLLSVADHASQFGFLRQRATALSPQRIHWIYWGFFVVRVSVFGILQSRCNAAYPRLTRSSPFRNISQSILCWLCRNPRSHSRSKSTRRCASALRYRHLTRQAWQDSCCWEGNGQFFVNRMRLILHFDLHFTLTMRHFVSWGLRVSHPPAHIWCRWANRTRYPKWICVDSVSTGRQWSNPKLPLSSQISLRRCRAGCHGAAWISNPSGIHARKRCRNLANVFHFFHNFHALHLPANIESILAKLRWTCPASRWIFGWPIGKHSKQFRTYATERRKKSDWNWITKNQFNCISTHNIRFVALQLRQTSLESRHQLFVWKTIHFNLRFCIHGTKTQNWSSQIDRRARNAQLIRLRMC